MFCQFFLAISCNSQLSSGHQHLLLVIWWKLCNSHEGAGLRPNPGLLWSLIMHWSDRLYALLIRPHICHFFSTNVLLGSIFLHMKARKLWQNFPKFLWVKSPPHTQAAARQVLRTGKEELSNTQGGASRCGAQCFPNRPRRGEGEFKVGKITLMIRRTLGLSGDMVDLWPPNIKVVGSVRMKGGNSRWQGPQW